MHNFGVCAVSRHAGVCQSSWPGSQLTTYSLCRASWYTQSPQRHINTPLLYYIFKSSGYVRYHKFSYFKIYAIYTWTRSKRRMKIQLLAHGRRNAKAVSSPRSMPILVTKQNSDFIQFIKLLKNKCPSYSRRYSRKTVTANFRKILQEKQCTYNVTLRCFLATIVQVEKQ